MADPRQGRPARGAPPAGGGRAVGGARRSRGAPPSARGVALRSLVEVERGARANEVVPALLDRSGLAGRDRHLVTELVYGSCRMRRAADWLVDRHLRGKADPQVRCALRLGAYQLAWTRVPAHAAVSETVAEVEGPARGLVNAVLRKVAADLRGGPPRWPDVATELSYPSWVVDRLTADLGAGDALGALRAMNSGRAVTIRDDGYAQDPASQMVAAHLAALAGGGLAVDLCAAPGGKATALASAGMEVVAAELSKERTSVLAANARRLGHRQVASVTADGTAPPLRGGCADLVLVDAPCSGLGVLGRRPDARWRSRPGDVERLAALQRRLLAAAGGLVRPGGILAYSVCTLTKAETAGVDRWLAAAAGELVPLPPPAAPWRPAGRGALLLPQAQGTDGMFLLVLRRRGGPPGRGEPPGSR